MKAIDKMRGAGGCGRASWLKQLAAGALVAGLTSTPVLAHGQQTEPRTAGIKPAAKLYRIAGTLTNSVTDEAVAGATIRLLAGQPRQMIQTTLTDASGHFELDPVPAAKYSLLASRRGYMTSSFDRHEQYSSAIVTGEGQDTEHIPFRLDPGAMIRGVVTDDAGEPVEGAKVLLMRRTKNGGLGEHLMKSISGETDDTGLFEFWNLVPGTYFLAVKADPWFALHPLASAQNRTASEEQREGGASLDVAYPVTYYTRFADEASATPIAIASGDRMQADVELHALPAVHLTVHAPEGNPGQQRFFGGTALHQTVFGDQDFLSFSFPQMGPPGSGLMEFAGIAPGHYSVVQGYPPRVTEIDTTGSQEVDLSSGVPTYSVEMSVRMADGSKPPQPLDVVLMSEDSVERHIDARMTEKPEVHFGSVPPGRWNVLVESNNTSLAVMSIQSGAAAAADSRIVVKDRGLSVTAVLAQGKTSIEGFVNKNGKGEAGVMVVLAPRDPGANLEKFRRDQSDSDGSFLLRDVVPGEYMVVAIEDGWDLDWARPKVIARYLKGGVPVTVAENSGASMRMSSPVPVQAR